MTSYQPVVQQSHVKNMFPTQHLLGASKISDEFILGIIAITTDHSCLDFGFI